MAGAACFRYQAAVLWIYTHCRSTSHHVCLLPAVAPLHTLYTAPPHTTGPSSLVSSVPLRRRLLLAANSAVAGCKLITLFLSLPPPPTTAGHLLPLRRRLLLQLQGGGAPARGLRDCAPLDGGLLVAYCWGYR